MFLSEQGQLDNLKNTFAKVDPLSLHALCGGIRECIHTCFMCD